MCLKDRWNFEKYLGKSIDYPGVLEFTQILNPIQRRYDAKKESRNPIPDNMSYFT